MAAQLSVTKACVRRALRWCSARAISSLAGAGLAVDEDGRIRRRHELQLLRDAAQRRTLPYDLRETAVRATVVCSVRGHCGRRVRVWRLRCSACVTMVSRSSYRNNFVRT